MSIPQFALFGHGLPIGRASEAGRLQHCLEQDGDCLIAGVPRSGRTALVRAVTQSLGGYCLEVDCLRATNNQRFLALYLDAIATAFTAPLEREQLRDWAIEHRISLQDEPTAFKFELGSSSRERQLSTAILALPQALAERFEQRVVVMFRNFSHLQTWDRKGHWEAQLRGEIARQTQVCYALIATAAEPWAIASGLEIIALNPLSQTTIEQWLDQQFADLGYNFSPEALQSFWAATQGHPGETETLARRLWLLQPSSTIERSLVDAAVDLLLEDLALTFESLLLLLPTSQVRLLESLAIDPTSSPQAQQYIQKHQLSRGGGLQGALNSLMQKGLIYGPESGYQIALPLFGQWLRRRVS
ncbi:ATP-binding protein [Synechococcus elongatus IITB4]|uniref:ATP-binding protein n=1 Tax=Synechococcus elongatus TaxID=32046 RepID=UPI0030D24343